MHRRLITARTPATCHGRAQVTAHQHTTLSAVTAHNPIDHPLRQGSGRVRESNSRRASHRLSTATTREGECALRSQRTTCGCESLSPSHCTQSQRHCDSSSKKALILQVTAHNPIGHSLQHPAPTPPKDSPCLGHSTQPHRPLAATARVHDPADKPILVLACERSPISHPRGGPTVIVRSTRSRVDARRSCLTSGPCGAGHHRTTRRIGACRVRRQGPRRPRDPKMTSTCRSVPEGCELHSLGPCERPPPARRPL